MMVLSRKPSAKEWTTFLMAVAIWLVALSGITSARQLQQVPQIPIAAVSVLFGHLLPFADNSRIEVQSADMAMVGPNVIARRVAECRFQAVETDGRAVQINFDKVSSEYTLGSTPSGGVLLTLIGTGDGFPFCEARGFIPSQTDVEITDENGTCRPVVRLNLSSYTVDRVLRALRFIASEVCPFRERPF
jgi:hypothetical protein